MGTLEKLDFTADVQDFHSNLQPYEQNAVKHALLAIAQIVEVSVKTYWGNLYNHMPKPELKWFPGLLLTSKSHNSEAYFRLLEVLGYNDEFNNVIEIPAIRER